MRICFVCLGNICRSPAAEAVFLQLAGLAGVDVVVDSAGTSRYHLGESPHASTRAEAARRGIPISHRGRQFVAADFDRFDLVVAMDRANRRDLLRLAQDEAAAAKIVLLTVDGVDTDVPDPWGQPQLAYAEMFDLLEVGCRQLVERVVEVRSGS